jgi:UDP-hydrolysing UDP-N-acetyl-D-glucosamine 2-epimerase
VSKKVLVTIGSRANFGRLETLIDSLVNQPDVDVSLVLHGSALSDRFGLNEHSINKIRPFILARFHTLLDSDSSVGVTKTISNSTSSFADVLNNYQPDCVIVGGDRYEILAPALASVMFSIPLIHIQGGEVTGNFDNKVRFCVSQLADYHFPSNGIAKNKLIDIGINSDRIYNLGCPGMDTFATLDAPVVDCDFLNGKGTGRKLNKNLAYSVVIFHPETLTHESETKTFDNIFEACSNNKLKNLVVFWPNADPGTSVLSKRLRQILEMDLYKELNIRVYKSFTPNEYSAILSMCTIAIGNSSSLVREGSFLGIPSVLLGNRQKDRIIDKNVLRTNNNVEDITASIKLWLGAKRPAKSTLYGDGNAGRNIARVISQLSLSVTGV